MEILATYNEYDKNVCKPQDRTTLSSNKDSTVPISISYGRRL